MSKSPDIDDQTTEYKEGDHPPSILQISMHLTQAMMSKKEKLRSSNCILDLSVCVCVCVSVRCTPGRKVGQSLTNRAWCVVGAKS